MFIRILCQEFVSNQSDVMTENQASTKLSTLSQKKDEDLYTYYYQTKTLFIKTARKNRVTHDGENTITLNRAEQHIPRDKIINFGFGLKVPELCLHMIEYRADLNCSLYGALKKAEMYFEVLNAKTEM